MSEEDLEETIKKMRFENEDKKQDAQRRMAWVALYGMIVYPFFTMIMVAIGLDTSVLASMADLYFVSVAGIIASFYGKEAYMSKHNSY